MHYAPRWESSSEPGYPPFRISLMGGNMTAIKTILWSIFVPGSITVIFPYLLLSPRFDSFRIGISGWRFFGLIPIIVGVTIYLWCAWNFTFIGKGTPAPFDPPKELVVKGPYQYVRNPMYVFAGLTLIGEAIYFETTILVLYAALAAIALHLWVVFYEEPSLRRKFGESYERYCERVSRWLPRLPHRNGVKTT